MPLLTIQPVGGGLISASFAHWLVHPLALVSTRPTVRVPKVLLTGKVTLAELSPTGAGVPPL